MKETKSELAVVGVGWKRRNPKQEFTLLIKKKDVSKLIFFFNSNTYRLLTQKLRHRLLETPASWPLLQASQQDPLVSRCAPGPLLDNRLVPSCGSAWCLLYKS